MMFSVLAPQQQELPLPVEPRRRRTLRKLPRSALSDDLAAAPPPPRREECGVGMLRTTTKDAFGEEARVRSWKRPAAEDARSGGRDEKAAENDGEGTWRLVVPKKRRKTGIRKKEEPKSAPLDIAAEETGADSSNRFAALWGYDDNEQENACSQIEVTVEAESQHDYLTTYDYARKTAVAASGSALVTLGVVMIPLPTPCGLAVVASGMAVLGTEFPAAQRVLDRTTEKVAQGLERMASLDEGSECSENDGAVMGDSSARREKRGAEQALRKGASRLAQKAQRLLG
eukprot:CAMPEP_0197455196 /NCGR_PEP_ID=MMETSP1175-20131217/40117_1 /TAXON_ID=1003142 /ORGANISM="Triceratium dubium, Strain CCMP147" /LENGTH=285 /DNA_ID=CAMNT_0042988987 /DNA_START=247 /DNA_END=1104 /DNA_ORIENTATION=-